MRLRLRAGGKLKVEGPAFIFVREGRIEILGKCLTSRERITIPKSKVALVTALEESIIDLNVGEGGKYEELIEPGIPYEWRVVAEELSRMPKPSTILILGGVDVGKTAFTIFLSNLMISKGNKVIIIDEDLGQSEIGAPTTIGMAYISRPIASLAQAKYLTAYFVGSTSPAGLIHRVLIGVRTLLDKAQEYNPDYIIINTDGWIYGKDARELKMGMIMLTKPNVVVAIQRGNEIEPIIRPFETQRWLRIIRLIAPPVTRTRTLDERRLIRESMYYKHLEGARVIKLSLNKVSLMYSDIGITYSLPHEEYQKLCEELDTAPLYVGYNNDALVVVLPRSERRIREIRDYLRSKNPDRIIKVIREGDERGLIVGLYDHLGNFLGIGVIQEIDYRKGFIKILSKAEGNISLIKLGRIKLDEQFNEVGKVESWPL